MADVSTDASASPASAAPGGKMRKRGGGGGDEPAHNGNEADAKKKKLDLGETGMNRTDCGVSRHRENPVWSPYPSLPRPLLPASLSFAFCLYRAFVLPFPCPN